MFFNIFYESIIKINRQRKFSNFSFEEKWIFQKKFTKNLSVNNQKKYWWFSVDL